MRHSVFAIFTVAFLFRVALVISLFHSSTINRTFGHSEAAGIAESLVLHHTYAGAYGTPQPTAWLAPVYPSLMAVAFLVFGVKTFASAVVLTIMNAGFGAVTAIYAYRIAANRFGGRIGFLAGWIWALCPYIALTSFVIWDTCLAGLVFAYAVWKLLSVEDCADRWEWIKCGIAWGVLALTSPVLLAPLPAWMIYLVWKKRHRLGLVSAMCLTIFLCAAPWCLRNALVVGTGFSPRSNGWAEIYYGEAGFNEHGTGPTGEYQRLSEAKYLELLRQRTEEFIGSHPGEFLRASLQRALWFWLVPTAFSVLAALLTILAIASLLMAPGYKTAPLAFILLFCPFIYYFCYSFSRYRYPVDVVVCVLAGYSLYKIPTLLGLREPA